MQLVVSEKGTTTYWRTSAKRRARTSTAPQPATSGSVWSVSWVWVRGSISVKGRQTGDT